MKKFLIISYMFPPIGGAGTQRPLKFAKYLPSFGIKPIVFCPEKASWKAYDKSPLSQPYYKDIQVYRCGIRSLSRYYRLRYKFGCDRHPYYYFLALKYFWYLDFFSAWYFECRKSLLNIARHENIDCVYTTSPPHSIHLFGRLLKANLGIPWIMDIRDAMTSDPNRPLGLFGHVQKISEKIYERSFYQSADAVVVVSKPMKESIIKRHTAMGIESKVHVITNGFDEEDYHQIKYEPTNKSKLTITYTGSFMGRQTPEFFLRALDKLIAANRIDSSDLMIRFIGHYDPHILEVFHRYANNLPLDIVGFQPQETCLRMQKDADLLLLIVNIADNEGGSQTMTGKFFEYIGAERPIFALVPDGPLKSVILSGRFGFVAAPRDIHSICKNLEMVYNRWRYKGRIEFNPDPTIRASYTRKRLTQELAILANSFGSVRK